MSDKDTCFSRFGLLGLRSEIDPFAKNESRPGG